MSISSSEQATVNTYIPAKLISKTDSMVLSAFGFECEEKTHERQHFYAPKYNECGELNVIDLRRFLEQAKQDYPPGRERPRWTETLEYLTEVGLDCPPGVDPATHYEELYGIDPASVFQGILNKSENDGPDAITEIVIIGAYTSVFMAPNEIGGWVTRITRDSIQNGSTSSMLETMRGADEDESALAQAAKDVIGNWEVGDLAAAVRELDSVLKERAETRSFSTLPNNTARDKDCSPSKKEKALYCGRGCNVVWTTDDHAECAACGASMTAEKEEEYYDSLTAAGHCQ